MHFRLIFLLTIFSACSQSPNPSEKTSDNDSMISIQMQDSSRRLSDSLKLFQDTLSYESNSGGEMMQDYFVVIVDTSRNYFKLRNTMYELSEKTGILVDTMGRYYDPKRGIIVPDDSEDEIYAGAYFPRRFEGSELSIEYFNEYSNQSHKTNMALVAGQYTETYTAQKQLRKIKLIYPNAFIIEAKLYNGCMH